MFELARITKLLFPMSDLDYPDLLLNKPKNTIFKHVNFGNNVLVGLRVKIGKKLKLEKFIITKIWLTMISSFIELEKKKYK